MNHNHSNGDGMKHMLLMVACCLIPILGILAIGAFGISLGPFSGLLPFAMALMCPLMMILMMRGMMQGQGQTHDHQEELKRKLSPAARTRVVTEPIAEEETDAPRCH